MEKIVDKPGSQMGEPNDWSMPPIEVTRPKSERSSGQFAALLSTIHRLTEAPTWWFDPSIFSLEATANLDDQQPPTLYYLGRIKDVPKITQIYVEKTEHEGVKHWAVIEDRDFEIMDMIYDIEEDTINRFPGYRLNFRVTVQTDDGPSISSQAIKIFDST